MTEELLICGFEPPDISALDQSEAGMGQEVASFYDRVLLKEAAVLDTYRKELAEQSDPLALTRSGKALAQKLGVVVPSPTDPPNSVSKPTMYRRPPIVTRWYADPARIATGLSRDQLRYVIHLVAQDWLGLTTREVSTKEEATLIVGAPMATVCGGNSVGCYSWSGGQKPVLEIKADCFPQWGRDPLLCIEIGVHELGHHFGFDDMYNQRSCSSGVIGGPNYLGCMGFAEGRADRFGGRPSFTEERVARIAKNTGTFPRC